MNSLRYIDYLSGQESMRMMVLIRINSFIINAIEKNEDYEQLVALRKEIQEMKRFMLET